MISFHKPFAIGLKPLDPANWLNPPPDLERYLKEKDRLYAAHPALVLAMEDETAEAQREIRDRLADYLPAQFPALYNRKSDMMQIGDCRQVSLTGDGPPLLTAARLVSDDLVLMRKSNKGWRLVAASLSFPSSWSLAEKFGKAITQIHEPVPGFGTTTRNAGIIERIFDNLSVEQPVWRQNWSLYTDNELHHSARSEERTDRFEEEALVKDPFIRIERQTLRKMPLSGDILFTIGIEVNRLSTLPQNRETADALHDLAGQLQSMSEAQCVYKGIEHARERLIQTFKSYCDS